MSSDIFANISERECPCKKEHIFNSEVIKGEGAITKLPKVVESFGAQKVFLLADKNTFEAAGKKAKELLLESGKEVTEYIFEDEAPEPDETRVGLAVMNFDKSCQIIVGVGSGVINDIGKILANVSGKPYIIVGTAPSMDGYASASSSMTMKGLKISLGSKCPDVIIGDTDILCKAPTKMMLSGLGDMLAKYVSILEWRISNLITGEYYCESVAKLVREALKKCVDNAKGLLSGDKKAVEAVFDGLVICGAAMKFAGLSRPASGIEHYLSHIWDMRKAEFGTSAEFHGIQCAVGTLISVRLYEKIKGITPDYEKGTSYAEAFDFGTWSETLRAFLGKGAESMIALEEKEQKYNKDLHKERLKKIIDNWDEILKLINEELPDSSELEALFESLGMMKTLGEMGIEENILPLTFKAAKDIRDKYVLPRLCWDLGILDEII